MTKVAIIGGGLVGASVAHRLLALGASVVLIDREDEGQATAAGAGILPPLDHFVRLEAVLPLLRAARAFYPELVAALQGGGVLDVGYDAVGALHVASSEEELAALPELENECERRREEGFEHIGAVTRLEATQARSLFPLLGPAVLGAVHCAGAARIDGRRLLAALRARSLAAGAELRRGSAAITCRGGHAVGVSLDGEELAADAVVVAGGAWSSLALAPLGVELPVRPQRGQLVHLELPGQATGKWPVVLGFAHQYLLGFPESRIVVGATREDGVGYDYRATAGGVRSVLDEALRLAPGLRAATLIETRVGFRPVSEDRRPLLGPLPGHPNVFVATGHAGYGLEVGPYSGALVADLVMARAPSIDLAAFAPGRFVGERSSPRAAAH
ncbi:MAG TPA: FAD-dependent oxidoreductase [Polyangiaceae bacterium]|nr:FAD-dependent oxidoreductase [Polyangiaceae bacterium]